MANNALDVLVGSSGKVYGGATGTTLPTTATASLAGGFGDLGYISEDGVAMSIGQDSSEIKAWGGSTIRKIQTSHTVELKLTMIETNVNSVAAFYGSSNVTSGTIKVTSLTNTRQEWVVDVVDGSNVVRLVVPDGEVTVHDDVVFKTDEAIGYGVTITCYEDTTGTKVYQYLTTPGVS